MARNITKYIYRDVPDVLPESTRKSNFTDTLDLAVMSIWDKDVKIAMKPVGRPGSRAFIVARYKAVQLIKEKAAVKGLSVVATADELEVLASLEWVAKRHKISPALLRITDETPDQAAE